MAKYTMELRKVCDYFTRDVVEEWFKSYNLTDFLTDEQIATINIQGIWNKDKLARKIVNHYFMREIGFETPALFKHYAKVTMEEIMEEKLPLIYSSAIKYDPLINVDFTETFERSQDGTLQNNASTSSNSNATSNGNSSSSDLGIDNKTPQQRITKQNLDTGAYASEVTQNDSNSNTNSSTTLNDNTQTQNNNISSNNEEYIKKIKGNSGVSATAQKMIEQYRQNIIAIDKQIIEELNTLFMGLY
ncbi:hypothetical protein [Faecalibacillus faecis]|uniref:hypothetical protein n=1 Tax=Faecalibacillus faecis TaxID=1982628 RepID=UPI00386526FC